MNRKKLISKIMTAVIAGGVLISSGTYVFAKSNVKGSTGVKTKTEYSKMNKKNPTDNMKSQLDKLVTAGTINQDQETKVLDYFKQKEADRKAEMDKVKNMTEAERKTYFESKKTTEKTNFLSELVTDNTLTQAQATAIGNAVHQGPGQKQPGANAAQVKTELDKLVTAGTITQGQETSIINAMKQEQTDMKAEMDKVKNMTEAERKTYFESKKNTRKTDYLNKLVTAGTLTEAQATTVKNAIHQGASRKGDIKNPNGFKTQLDKLVTAGTITQDEETKILKYMTDKQTERKAEMDKVKNMTAAERKTYLESKKTSKKTDFLSELVSKGIISQDKANAIKTAMPTPKAPGAGQHMKTN